MGRISGMQIAPEQGAFMGMIAKAIGAKRYLEIGSFTGYSALAVTLALPADGHSDCLDISEEFIGKARGYWGGGRLFVEDHGARGTGGEDARSFCVRGTRRQIRSCLHRRGQDRL